MIVQHLKYPFYHTIIYDYFSRTEVADIYQDKKFLQSKGDPSQFIDKEDFHHQELIKSSNVVCYSIDKLLGGESNTKRYMRKIISHFEIGSLEFTNPFLNYIPLANQENCHLNIYKNESYYSKHHDGAVLTALYLFWEGIGNRNGGDFLFSEYNYIPHLENNSCIIFPSFVMHEVTKMTCDDSISRITINQRFYI